MKAVRLHAFGGPEVLRYEEVVTPEPEPGHVRVRVRAAGINYADVMQRLGRYPMPITFPHVPGLEIAGTIDALGAGVTGLAIGDRVFGTTLLGGGYAEYAVAASTSLSAIPAGLEDAEATALLVQGQSALGMLEGAGRLRAGETVLLTAAAGGVGTLAVQIAQCLGAARVIGLARGERKLAHLRSLGADAVDYTEAGWPERVRALTGGRGVDVAVDAIAGEMTGTLIGCLAPSGRVVIFGMASGAPASIDPVSLLFQNQEMIGFGIYANPPERLSAWAARLADWAARGEVRVHVSARWPLAEAALAHVALGGRETIGKLVLEP